jgi:CDP-2,3-bis-(O-geranylgeranyl)-sn-glycerol synthase
VDSGNRNVVVEADLLVLLLVANGSPVGLRMLLGKRWRQPLDAGRRLTDDQPIFGPSKTLAGLAVALVSTSLCAIPIGLGFWVGLSIAIFAMLGDLLSSFIKRRLARPPGTMTLGLDQVPESLLPLLVCKPLLGLSWVQVLLVTLAFIAADLLISQLMYRLGIGNHPH